MTGFDTGDEQVPYAPTGLAWCAPGPGEVNLTWNDVAFDETGFVVRGWMGNGAFEDIATLPADSRGYLDNARPVRVPLESSLEYQVVAANNAGRSAPSQSRSLTFGGPGGTGLRQRIWDNINSVSREGVLCPHDRPRGRHRQPHVGLWPAGPGHRRRHVCRRMGR